MQDWNLVPCHFSPSANNTSILAPMGAVEGSNIYTEKPIYARARIIF